MGKTVLKGESAGSIYTTANGNFLVEPHPDSKKHSTYKKNTLYKVDEILVSIFLENDKETRKYYYKVKLEDGTFGFIPEESSNEANYISCRYVYKRCQESIAGILIINEFKKKLANEYYIADGASISFGIPESEENFPKEYLKDYLPPHYPVHIMAFYISAKGERYDIFFHPENISKIDEDTYQLKNEKRLLIVKSVVYKRNKDFPSQLEKYYFQIVRYEGPETQLQEALNGFEISHP